MKSKQRADVEVLDEVEGVVVFDLDVIEDDGVVEKSAGVFEVMAAGTEGPAAVVAGNARDTEPEPLGMAITVSVILVVELRVVVGVSVEFALVANPGEANPIVVLATGRLDMA